MHFLGNLFFFCLHFRSHGYLCVFPLPGFSTVVLPTCSEPSLLRLHPQEEAQQLWVCTGVGWGWEGSFFPFPSPYSFLSPLKLRANTGTIGNHARRSDRAYLVRMNRFPAPQSRLFARMPPLPTAAGLCLSRAELL